MTQAWVTDHFLVGHAHELCLSLPNPITRGTLRALVQERRTALRESGIGAGSAVLMHLPATTHFVTTVLATWQLGAQLVVLDHRVPAQVVDQVVATFTPALVVSPDGDSPRGQHLTRRTEHALVQVSSGSTGSPKAIGRTVADVVAEVGKLTDLEGMPGPGDTAILLASPAHMYGFFAGLLHSLAHQAHLVIPATQTVSQILRTTCAASTPVTLLGVPFHLKLLTAMPLAQGARVARFICSGDRLEPALAKAFTARFGAPVAQLYGSTETGAIAADVTPTRFSGVGHLLPGVRARIENGELCVRLNADPYLFRPDLGNWRDGWFHTGDAATIDLGGFVQLAGRLDSQVAVGGLKVNLLDVERELRAIGGVREAVVVFDREITAYLELTGTIAARRIQESLTDVLAPHQRPRIWKVVEHLPRTANGKLVRNLDRLANHEDPR